MCNTDYDIAAIYRQTYVIARKSHTYSECRGLISPGNQYQYIFGKWDSDVSVFKTCIDCCVPQKWLLEECDGFIHGDLYSEILEHAWEYKKMFLYRWVIAMEKRRKRNKYSD